MSGNYTHIVVAIDLTSQSGHVIEQALPIAEKTGARISLVHTLEPIGYTYGADLTVDVETLQKELNEHARQRLADVAAPYSIPAEQQHILVGQADISISEFANHEGVDLIVVGSHGRTGLAVLLGSTSSTLMRNVDCDILAVRISIPEEDVID